MFEQSLSASKWAQTSSRPSRFGGRDKENARPASRNSIAPLAQESYTAKSSQATASSSLDHVQVPPVQTQQQQTPATSPTEQHLTRLTRLLVRLQWKAHLLVVSLENSATFSPSSLLNGIDSGAGLGGFRIGYALEGTGAAMFKLDFYEYYNLFERALASLLNMYRVPITPADAHAEQSANASAENRAGGFIIGNRAYSREDTRSSQTPRNSSTTAQDESSTTQRQLYIGSSHRYHAAIIDALSRVDGPLTHIFGPGTEAGAHLRRAKELRNRWKETEALPADTVDANGGTELAAFFSSVDELKHMLEFLVGALEHAVANARRDAPALAFLDRGQAARRDEGAQQMLLTRMEDGDVVMEEAPWEAYLDAMHF